MNAGIVLLAFAVGGSFGAVAMALLFAHGERERLIDAQDIRVEVEQP